MCFRDYSCQDEADLMACHSNWVHTGARTRLLIFTDEDLKWAADLKESGNKLIISVAVAAH